MSFTFSPSPAPQSPKRSNLPKSLGWIAIAIWTVMAIVAYLGLDAILAWLLANGGQLAQNGMNLGAAFGAEVDPALQALGVSGLWEQGLALLRTILLPIVVLVWLIVSIAIFALPRFVGSLTGMAGKLLR